jgi:hypothetical protein
MFDEPLPPELIRVEQDVSSWMRWEPPAEFGRRVIGAIRGELRRERRAANWKFALGLAAGAFLWLHLSFYAAAVTNFHFHDMPPAMATDPLAAERHTVFGRLPDSPLF